MQQLPAALVSSCPLPTPPWDFSTGIDGQESKSACCSDPGATDIRSVTFGMRHTGRFLISSYGTSHAFSNKVGEVPATGPLAYLYPDQLPMDNHRSLSATNGGSGVRPSCLSILNWQLPACNVSNRPTCTRTLQGRRSTQQNWGCELRCWSSTLDGNRLICPLVPLKPCTIHAQSPKHNFHGSPFPPYGSALGSGNPWCPDHLPYQSMLPLPGALPLLAGRGHAQCGPVWIRVCRGGQCSVIGTLPPATSDQPSLSTPIKPCRPGPYPYSVSVPTNADLHVSGQSGGARGTADTVGRESRPPTGQGQLQLRG